jgi:hypothetical protein
MSVCVAANTLDPSSIYPVCDPRRTAGPGPYNYGYALAWDGLVITVVRDSALASCQMTVDFSSTLSEGKEIQAWNFFNNNFVDRIGSSSLGLLSSMVIQKAGNPGLSCGSGADTVILCRYFAWPRGRTALYSFDPQDFWDFWGGCTVTFDWFSDTQGSGIWGNDTPQPTYPLVQHPDGTVMRNATDDGELVIWGGAGFPCDSSYLSSLGLSGPAIPFSLSLPSTPADGTLVREVNQSAIFVVFGGAKFHIPPVIFKGVDPKTRRPTFVSGLSSLGFSPSDIRKIPPGGTNQLLTIPIEGTLLREQHGPKVYLVTQGELRWVTSPAVMDSRCLAWRNIRVVPDHVLAALPQGPDLY